MNTQARPARRIAIFHPEGNFNNNPHLSATVAALCRHGYRVDLHAIRKGFNQAPPHPDANVFLYSKYVMRMVRLLSWSRFGRWPAAWLCAWRFRHVDADLIIGVDDNGVIVAHYLGRKFKRPVALISYELLFAAEVSRRRKAAEIFACEGIAFAVVQDRKRGELLAAENRIDSDKLVYMPVADWSSAAAQRGWLRETLGIADDRKIALAMGSLDDWTGLRTVLDGLRSWPADWALVLHGRYGLAAEVAKALLADNPQNLYISTEAFDSNDDLGKLLGDADIGLGLYCPDFRHEHTGLNLQYIGLASGKIATFLRFGVPVLVNFEGEMADDVAGEGLGVVVPRVEDIPQVLAQVPEKDAAASARCQQFFDRKLAVSASFESLLERIDKARAAGPGRL